MVLTRLQARAAFCHVMDNVLECNDLKSALVKEGYDDIISLLSIGNETIESLTYVDSIDTTKVLPVKRGHMNTLKVWIAYYIHQFKCGNPINDIDDWLSMSQESFDAFRSNPLNMAHLMTPRSQKVTTPKDTSYDTTKLLSRAPLQGYAKYIDTSPTVNDVSIVKAVIIASEYEEEQLSDGNVKVDEDEDIYIILVPKEEESIEMNLKEKEGNEHVSAETTKEPNVDFSDCLRTFTVIDMVNIFYTMTAIAFVIAGLMLASWFMVPIPTTPVQIYFNPSLLPQPWFTPPWITFMSHGEESGNIGDSIIKSPQWSPFNSKYSQWLETFTLFGTVIHLT